MKPKASINPPPWAQKLLQWLCPDELLEEVQGDLQELYEERVAEAGKKQAGKEYVWSVLGYLRPLAFKKNTQHYTKPLYIDMLLSYLTIASRMLLRHKLRTFIHILGLSIGISTCLSIYQIIIYELSFDTHLSDQDRIYQVVSSMDNKGETHMNSGIPTPAPTNIGQEITGIEQVAAFVMVSAKVALEQQGKRKTFGRQNDVIFTDPGYLKLLPFQWLSGSRENSLTAPHQVVLTEQKMQQYFGKADPQSVIGRELIYQDSIRVLVTGVVKDLEGHTDFTFKDFLSISTIKQTPYRHEYFFDDWNTISSSSRALVKLTKGSKKEEVNKQLAALSDKYFSKEDGFIPTLQLQPFHEIHFKGGFDTISGPSLANPPALYGLSMIALFILLIACINFINLETAQAIYRAKEVGIRKTLGSKRRELIWQFMSETLLITFLAVLISLACAKAMLYYFQDLIPQGVALTVFSPATLLFLLALVVVVGFLAGFYPAIVLSAYSPAHALRRQVSKWSSQTRSAFLRKNLTVVQFTLSQLFIFGTLVIGQQIRHMLHADMGFDKDAIVYIRTPAKSEENQKLFLKGQISQIPGVSAVSISNDAPASTSMRTNGVEFASPVGKVSHEVQQKLGDTTFLRLYNIPLLAGRNIGERTEEVLINETYLKMLGFARAEDALQQSLQMNDKSLTIVGVMADFHLRPLNETILPAMYSYDLGSRYAVINIKLQSKNANSTMVKQTLAKVKTIWKEQFPEEPFTYSFLDETINSFYRTEENILKMLRVATGVAILISCMGLLGLSSFTISQRMKEIGIRKVLGASLCSIIILISRDFLRLVLIAYALAAPIAWLLLEQWLEAFVYRIDLQWWMFLLVGTLALLAAILTVSYQSVKAASVNPVKSLRSE